MDLDGVHVKFPVAGPNFYLPLQGTTDSGAQAICLNAGPPLTSVVPRKIRNPDRNRKRWYMDNSSGDGPQNQENRPPKNPTGSGEESRRRGFGPMTFFLILLLLVTAYYVFDDPSNHGTTVSFSFFRQQLDANNVETVRIYGDKLIGKWKKFLSLCPLV